MATRKRKKRRERPSRWMLQVLRLLPTEFLQQIEALLDQLEMNPDDPADETRFRDGLEELRTERGI